MNKILPFLIMLFMCIGFATTGCDEERDEFKRPHTTMELAGEECYNPSKKILVFAPWPPHFVWILDDCDIEEIKCKLLSEDDWRVEGQTPSGSEAFCVIDYFTFRVGGYVIDIRNAVKLQLFVSELHVPNGHYPQYTNPNWPN